MVHSGVKTNYVRACEGNKQAEVEETGTRAFKMYIFVMTFRVIESKSHRNI